MGRKSNDAAVKDAQIKLRKEECALGMGHRSSTNDAARKDAQVKFGKEECALDMRHIVMHKMNLLHLDQKRRLLQPKHVQISDVLDLHSEDQKEIMFQER